jgi:molybdenum cofactor cytidylyltransferase
MLRPETTALVLLAAGQARRFGGDKLTTMLRGKPLVLHAVAALAAVPFATRVAVVSGTQLDLAGEGFDVVHNPNPAAGQGPSLHLGVTAARAAGAKAVLIALADMPCVTAAHVRRLFDTAEGADAVVASSSGERPMPPALFGAAQFEALLSLDGDVGARALIRSGRQVLADPAELVDIDTREDLAALEARLGSA